MTEINTLFLDIGGVLLTNGWDRKIREKAAQYFDYDLNEFNEKHHKYFNLHETDQITFDEYLKKTVFCKARKFTLEEFKKYIFDQTEPFTEMIDMFKRIKREYHLKIAAVSNEGRDLADYRIRTYQLKSFIDCFFVSSFVYFQKPDPHIFQIALDVMQVSPHHVIYVDDRAELIEAGANIGLHTIHHTSFASTQQELLLLLSGKNSLN